MTQSKSELRKTIALLEDSIGLQVAESYGEPGYKDPEKPPPEGILFADWNDVPQETQDTLEQRGYALEWSDEWRVVNGVAYRTHPTNYFWESRVMYSPEVGDYLTPDWLPDWIIECRIDSVVERVQCLPSWFPAEAIAAEGYELMETDLQSGSFLGMDDKPEDFIHKYLTNGAEYVLFQRSEQSQFYSKYKVFCKMAKCV